MTADPDRERGLYAKYRVLKRISFTDQRGDDTVVEVPYTGECFVLAEHDPIAVKALRLYAELCAKDYPKLSLDLHNMCDRWLTRATSHHDWVVLPLYNAVLDEHRGWCVRRDPDGPIVHRAPTEQECRDYITNYGYQ
jgi:hypothetical protein